MAIQLSNQQLWTLAKLGIPVWQLRQHSALEPIAEPPSSQEQLTASPETFNANTQLLVCYPATQVPAEQQLLANIMKAIAGLGVTFESCDLAALTDLPADTRLPAQVFIFGGLPVNSRSDLQNRCVLLPSLADLITEPAHKASVWAAICQLSRQVT